MRRCNCGAVSRLAGELHEALRRFELLVFRAETLEFDVKKMTGRRSSVVARPGDSIGDARQGLPGGHRQLIDEGRGEIAIDWPGTRSSGSLEEFGKEAAKLAWTGCLHQFGGERQLFSLTEAVSTSLMPPDRQRRTSWRSTG